MAIESEYDVFRESEVVVCHQVSEERRQSFISNYCECITDDAEVALHFRSAVSLVRVW